MPCNELRLQCNRQYLVYLYEDEDYFDLGVEKYIRYLSEFALPVICPIKILVNDDFMRLFYAIDFNIQLNVIVTSVPYGPRLPSP